MSMLGNVLVVGCTQSTEIYGEYIAKLVTFHYSIPSMLVL
jgi:hypothetical protein